MYYLYGFFGKTSLNTLHIYTFKLKTLFLIFFIISLLGLDVISFVILYCAPSYLKGERSSKNLDTSKKLLSFARDPSGSPNPGLYLKGQVSKENNMAACLILRSLQFLEVYDIFKPKNTRNTHRKFACTIKEGKLAIQTIHLQYCIQTGSVCQ